jgi:hypothetical protein
LQNNVWRDTFFERFVVPERATGAAKKGDSMNPIAFHVNLMRTVGRRSTMVLFAAEGHIR